MPLFEKHEPPQPTSISALLEAGKFAEALPKCQEAVERNPESATKWTDLARTLSGLQRFEEATTACENAISLDGHSTWAWNNRGVALMGLHRYEEALAAFDQACSLDPEALHQGRTTQHHNRFRALYFLRRYQEALAEIDTLLSFAPRTAHYWIVRGETCDQLENFTEAEDAFLRAKRLEPRNRIALTDLCRLYMQRTHEYDKALDVSAEFVRVFPKEGASHQVMGETLAYLDRHDEARAAYERALACDTLRGSSRARLWANIAYLSITKGQLGDALQTLDKGASFQDAFEHHHLTVRGVILDRIDRHTEALPYFEEAIKAAKRADVINVGPHANATEQLIRLGRLDEAKSALDETFALNANYGCAWYAAGMLEMVRERYDDALTAFHKAIMLEPRHAPHYAGLAELLLKLDAAEQAFRVITPALELDEYTARHWRIKGQVLRAVGQVEEADAAENRAASLLADQQAQVDTYLAAQPDA